MIARAFSIDVGHAAASFRSGTAGAFLARLFSSLDFLDQPGLFFYYLDGVFWGTADRPSGAGARLSLGEREYSRVGH